MAKPNIFNSIQLPKVGSSNFDLSHDVKLSLDMGQLVPTLCQEVLPGDVWRCQNESMVRFAPLVAPVMHRFRVFHHYFFVPSRLLWKNFYPWLFEQEAHVFPFVNLVTEAVPDSIFDARAALGDNFALCDYLGIPDSLRVDSFGNIPVNPMPFAGYQFIWNEYYRDQNLQEPLDYELVDGDVTSQSADLLFLRNRAWRHDQFTSALPFPQRGDDVLIPLGDIEDVQVYRQSADGGGVSWTNDVSPGTGTTEAQNFDGTVGQDGELIARTGDLQAQAASIRDLRRAFKLQEWLERNARGGVRAKEGLLSHFGVRVQDQRLDRPEFIYGTSSNVVVSEVLQTAEGTDPVGNMAGHGISVDSSGRKSYYAPEHGYIYSIMSIMPEPAYQQGMPRHFLKGVDLDRFSFAWPTFQHIGEQELYNKEIYAASAEPKGTFGYVPRYSEYKYIPSSVHGDFRTTLNHWHDGRIFETEPALNEAFIECNPSKRIFAVTEGNSIWAQVYHNLKVRRKLSYYSNPGF